MLELNNLIILPSLNEGILKATCIATFNDALVISGIQIKEDPSGLCVTFPPDVAPRSEDIRKDISNRILATFVINHCCKDSFDEHKERMLNAK